MNVQLQPVHDRETPWMHLKNLLDNHHAEIFDREKSNEKFIHLYGHGAYWSAFEQSACQLCTLFPHSDITILRFRDYPFPAVMASVTDKEVRTYIRQHLFRAIHPDYLILAVSELSFDRFRNWHRAQLKDIACL